MNEADRLWAERADAIIAKGSDVGVATICLVCEGVVHRSDSVRARGWIPRYCECKAATTTAVEDFAAHGLTVEGAGGEYFVSGGRVND